MQCLFSPHENGFLCLQEQDSVLRDYFGELEFIDRQDVCLGFDTEGYSYHYISHFGATDIRIYKQKMVTNPSIPKLRDQVLSAFMYSWA